MQFTAWDFSEEAKFKTVPFNGRSFIEMTLTTWPFIDLTKNLAFLYGIKDGYLHNTKYLYIHVSSEWFVRVYDVLTWIELCQPLNCFLRMICTRLSSRVRCADVNRTMSTLKLQKYIAYLCSSWLQLSGLHNLLVSLLHNLISVYTDVTPLI